MTMFMLNQSSWLIFFSGVVNDDVYVELDFSSSPGILNDDENSSSFCLLLIVIGIYTIFHNSIFYCICIFSYEYNVLFYHA